MWIFYIVEFTWYVCLHTQYKYYNIPFDSNIHVTVTVWTLQNLTNTNISLWTIWIQYSGCCGNRPKNPSSGGGTIAKGDKRGARPVGGPPSHLAIVQLTSVTSHCLTGTRAVETDCCVVHTAQQHPVTSQRDDKDSLWDISCNLSYPACSTVPWSCRRTRRRSCLVCCHSSECEPSHMATVNTRWYLY